MLFLRTYFTKKLSLVILVRVFKSGWNVFLEGGGWTKKVKNPWLIVLYLSWEYVWTCSRDMLYPSSSMFFEINLQVMDLQFEPSVFLIRSLCTRLHCTQEFISTASMWLSCLLVIRYHKAMLGRLWFCTF